MGEREWVRGREDDRMRVGKVFDPTDQQKEIAAGMVVAGSGIQVNRRTGRGMGMSFVMHQNLGVCQPAEYS